MDDTKKAIKDALKLNYNPYKITGKKVVELLKEGFILELDGMSLIAKKKVRKNAVRKSNKKGN